MSRTFYQANIHVIRSLLLLKVLLKVSKNVSLIKPLVVLVGGCGSIVKGYHQVAQSLPLHHLLPLQDCYAIAFTKLHVCCLICNCIVRSSRIGLTAQFIWDDITGEGHYGTIETCVNCCKVMPSILAQFDVRL